MKAMVLAAGQGTRLRPITDRMPKALVPVAGRPMIEFALLLLRRYGVRDIVINLHHFGTQIEDHLGDGQRFDVNISYSHETELLGHRRRTAQSQSVFTGRHVHRHQHRRLDRRRPGGGAERPSAEPMRQPRWCCAPMPTPTAMAPSISAPTAASAAFSNTDPRTSRLAPSEN